MSRFGFGFALFVCFSTHDAFATSRHIRTTLDDEVPPLSEVRVLPESHSDFPLTIEAGEWGPQSVNGTIGAGGGQLNLETVNGEIELRKS